MRYLLSVFAALLFVSNAYAQSGRAYVLIGGVTATQAAPNLVVSPLQAQGGPVSSQAFVVWVTGGGSASCTVQFLGGNGVDSNGNVIWTNYGSTVTANASIAGSSAYAFAAVGSTPYVYYSAIVTAISGTGARCFASMSA